MKNEALMLIVESKRPVTAEAIPLVDVLYGPTSTSAAVMFLAEGSYVSKLVSGIAPYTT